MLVNQFMSAEKILVVEDNVVDMSLLAGRLIREGYEVVRAVSGTEAMQTIRVDEPQLMILDLTLAAEDRLMTPLWDGFSLVEWMQRVLPGMELPVIVHTASPISAAATQARKMGIRCVFQKGDDLDELLCRVREALDGQTAKPAA